MSISAKTSFRMKDTSYTHFYKIKSWLISVLLFHLLFYQCPNNVIIGIFLYVHRIKIVTQGKVFPVRHEKKMLSFFFFQGPSLLLLTSSTCLNTSTSDVSEEMSTSKFLCPIKVMFIITKLMIRF